MPKPKEKPVSPGLRFVRMIWDHALESTGHSWQRLNWALSDTLRTAIKSGMRFDLDDFKTMRSTMRTGYWWGESGSDSYYRDACEVDNLSACHAIEALEERQPFILLGRRLARSQELSGELARALGHSGRIKLNSWSGKDEINAGIYVYEDGRDTLKKKFRITREMIAAANKSARDAKKAEKAAKEEPAE